jgi:cyclopropane-fatty-acyl-phospholipid synthase
MILKHAQMGFCEAYMMGYVSSPDLVKVIELASVQQDVVEKGAGFSFARKLLLKWQHWRNRNNRRGSRRNISFHYDLGNRFYASWLDQSMTYSSAYYGDETNDLYEAQQKKYARMAELAGVTKDSHVLEVGCGWGGFAEHAAAEYGARVTAITISQEQYDFARTRIENAGLSHLVDIQLIDYRDVTGTYDSIVSIEMIEAVGELFWPSYFQTLSDCLKPNGKAAIQMITMNDRDYDYYRSGPDFIQRYIFPGGMLPAMNPLQPIFDKTGLELISADGFGLDYARTLAVWRDRFWDAWDHIADMGFDDRFKRMWELYLMYCEGGFRTGYIDVKHVLLERKQMAEA